MFPRVFQTITVDNGGEFSDVKSLERSILRKGRRTKMYYCHPYTSCERGSNEWREQNGSAEVPERD